MAVRTRANTILAVEQEIGGLTCDNPAAVLSWYGTQPVGSSVHCGCSSNNNDNVIRDADVLQKGFRRTWTRDTANRDVDGEQDGVQQL